MAPLTLSQKIQELQRQGRGVHEIAALLDVAPEDVAQRKKVPSLPDPPAPGGGAGGIGLPWVDVPADGAGLFEWSDEFVANVVPAAVTIPGSFLLQVYTYIRSWDQLRGTFGIAYIEDGEVTYSRNVHTVAPELPDAPETRQSVITHPDGATLCGYFFGNIAAGDDDDRRAVALITPLEGLSYGEFMFP